MGYYSAIKRNACESVLMKWMNLEPIIQSEISQKGKYIYINTYIYMEAGKMALTILFAGQQWRCWRGEQTCGHRGERRGRDELKEQHWNTFIDIYKVDSQWGSALWHRELKLGALWQPRRVGGAREAQEGGDICVPMTDSCWCIAEISTILQSNYLPIKN